MKYSFKKSFLILLTFLTLVVSAMGVTPAYAAPIVVVNTNDSGAGSLRQAIADITPGETITFDGGLAGQTIVLTSTLTINKNLTIDGSSLASQITISGGGSVRLFIVNAGNTVVINSLKITNGLGSTAVPGFFSEGAGIFNAGTLTVTNSTFTANAVSAPGEFEAGGAISNHGTLTVTGTTFSGNHSTFIAGAIYNYIGATATVANNTFVGNSGSDGGGGIFNRGTLNLFNNTFSANFTGGGTDGGGLMNWDEGTLHYANNIIADSMSGGNCVDTPLSTIGTNTNNLVEGGGCSAAVTADPMLNALANNGGPSQTMSLQAGSPALGAGNATICSAAPVNNLDQRGEARPQGNTNCDLGAYESSFADLSAPTVVSIQRVTASPSTAATVSFTVTFSEAVSGVSTSAPFSDFALTTSGVSGASIITVTGSGASYTVTVLTGSGNGTLRLDVPVSATITDFAGNALGSLPFTGGQSYTILKVATYTDVPTSYWAWQFVERLSMAGITGGCGNNNYCPDASVTRAQMAIFLLRGIHGSSYTPPAVGGSTGFGDVQTNYWAAAWIKQLAAEGITGGCGNGNYCPDASVTRAQMAIFLLRAKYGASYSPPAVGGSTGFGDVQPTYWASAWIKQLVAEGITSGCGNGNYCPDAFVTRAQMAVFLVRTFNLP